MDANTGKIYRGNYEEIKRVSRELDRELVPISEDEASELERLPPRVRKNKMRNKRCLCGSGVKFKRCCWSKYQ